MVQILREYRPEAAAGKIIDFIMFFNVRNSAAANREKNEVDARLGRVR